MIGAFMVRDRRSLSEHQSCAFILRLDWRDRKKILRFRRRFFTPIENLYRLGTGCGAVRRIEKQTLA